VNADYPDPQEIPMEKPIAACGLDCHQCPAYQARIHNDDELRRKTATEWTQAFGFSFAPEMINCDGCQTVGGVQIGHCSQCQVRACTRAQGRETCAGCPDLAACSLVADIHRHTPEARKNLEASIA